MTFREPVKFRLFYWECEEEGSGYYSRNLVGVLRPVLDPVKYVLAPAIGMLDQGAILKIFKLPFDNSILKCDAFSRMLSMANTFQHYQYNMNARNNKITSLNLILLYHQSYMYHQPKIAYMYF